MLNAKDDITLGCKGFGSGSESVGPHSAHLSVSTFRVPKEKFSSSTKNCKVRERERAIKIREVVVRMFSLEKQHLAISKTDQFGKSDQRRYTCICSFSNEFREAEKRTKKKIAVHEQLRKVFFF